MSIPPDYKTDYLLVVGQIEIEWNRLETALFVVFRHFIGARTPKANAVFFSQVNHRARREMVESLAPIVLARMKGKTRQFSALMRRMKNAAKKRNEVVHTLWGWEDGEPWAIWEEQAPPELMQDNLLKEMRSRAQTIRAVREDLETFYASLPNMFSPWPYKRPRPGQRRPERW